MREKFDYTVQFTSPAFLGNAEQKGQWRTPPFKALLRQWWRVAVAGRFEYDHEKIREQEGRLFGHAWLTTTQKKAWAMQSQVQLGLEPQDPNQDRPSRQSTSWPSGELQELVGPNRKFESVKTTRDGRGKVRSDLYLGFGPVAARSKKENRLDIALAMQPAIGPHESAKLSIRSQLDPGQQSTLRDAIQLMHWFGTLGSRSRNGWGSLSLTGHDHDILDCEHMTESQLFKRVQLPFVQCLQQEWAHAIGTDRLGPLVWWSPTLNDWREVVHNLARVLVRVRRVAKDYSRHSGYLGRGHIAGIHLLGYPAGGKWEMHEWDKNRARLSSPLRFKVIRSGNGVRAMVFHLPCRLPESMASKMSRPDRAWLDHHQQLVWERIHETLDQGGDARLKRDW